MRLNRIHPDKQETMVLDLANEAEEIRKAFEPYHGRTTLQEGTDPNLLYDLETLLLDLHVFDERDVDAFPVSASPRQRSVPRRHPSPCC